MDDSLLSVGTRSVSGAFAGTSVPESFSEEKNLNRGRVQSANGATTGGGIRPGFKAAGERRSR